MTRKTSGLAAISLTRRVSLIQEIYADHSRISSASSYQFEGRLMVLPIKSALMPWTFKVCSSLD